MKRVNVGRIVYGCIMAISVFTDATYGQGGTSRVDIESALQTVKNGEPFQISANFKNVSGDVQSIQVWSCSLPKQWVSDNPAVRIPDVPCKKNSGTWVELKPGEAYNNQLSVHIALDSDHRAPQPVKFRLGFHPISFEGPAPISFPVWGNALTIDVVDN